MNFNVTRIGKLIKRDYLVFRKPINYGFLGTTILLLGIILINVVAAEEADKQLRVSFWFDTYRIFLLAGGLMLTSIIYWEFSKPSSRITYLSIPASNLEKVMTRWFYSLIVFPLVLTLLFTVSYHLTQLVNGPVAWDTPLSDLVREMFRYYIGLHALFFLFAVWINNYAAPKTAIISLLVCLAMAVVFAVLFRIVFSELFVGWEMTGNYRIEPKADFQDRFENFGFPMLKYMSPIGIAVYLWVVTYFKMKEKEV